jgi:hypothetical protein
MSVNISLDVAGIFISAFICFSLAALWFSSALFGNLWQKQLTKNSLITHELSELKTFVYAFVSLIVFAAAMNVIICSFNVTGMKEGVEVGIAIWFLITFAHAVVHFAFERRSIILFGIYSSYYIAASVIISTLLAMRR